MVNKGNKRRQQRNNDNAIDDASEMLFDEWQGPKIVSGAQQGSYPQDATRNVIERKLPQAHVTNASDEWRKRADDGNEAGHDDGFATVFFIKAMRFFQMFFIQQPGGFGRKNTWADGFANEVIHFVPDDGGEQENDKK